MIYEIDTEIFPNYKVWKLYKDHFPEKYHFMRKKAKEKKLNLWVVARDGDRVAGAVGIKEQEPNYYRYLHIVVHPDYRGNGIANNIRYMTLKLLLDKGATFFDNIKTDNMFSHERFQAIGFRAQEVYINKDSTKWYHYKCSKERLNMEKLETIWKNIKQD